MRRSSVARAVGMENCAIMHSGHIARKGQREIKDIANANHGWNIVGWYISKRSAESDVAGKCLRALANV